VLGRFCLLGIKVVSDSEWYLGKSNGTDYSDLVVRDHFIRVVLTYVGGKSVSLLNAQLASEQLPACPCFGILTFICVTSR